MAIEEFPIGGKGKEGEADRESKEGYSITLKFDVEDWRFHKILGHEEVPIAGSNLEDAYQKAVAEIVSLEMNPATAHCNAVNVKVEHDGEEVSWKDFEGKARKSAQ